jgi:uncharacterized membrane protein HdeD (DUF308 family)
MFQMKSSAIRAIIQKFNSQPIVKTLRLSPVKRKTCDLISDRQLQLAGFTLTAIAFITGFYKDAFTEAASLLISLLIAMFLLLLGSFVAHEAEVLWQAFASDVLQYCGVISLVASFSFFLVNKVNNQMILVLPLILAVALFFYLLRGVWRMHKFYKEFNKEEVVEVLDY